MEWIRKQCKTYDREGDVRQWPEWEFFDDLVSDLEKPGVSLWIKSRQMMCSWLAAAYALHCIVFNPRITVIVISRNLEQVLDIHARVEFMHENLPPEYQLPRKTDNQKVFDLKHENNFSTIKFSPASRSAGRGPQTYFFIADEFAFMIYAGEIFTGMKPSIDGGGRGLILSTGNGNSKKNKFAQLIHDRHELQFKYREVHYSLCPEKDDEWKERARVGLSQAEWDQEHECKLITKAGLVYPEYTDNLNTCPLPDMDENGKFFISIDYGWNNPFVAILYYSPGPDYETMFVIAEHYEREMLLEDHAQAIVEMMCVPRIIGSEHVEDPPPVPIQFGNSMVSDPSAKQDRMELEAWLIRRINEYWLKKPQNWQNKYKKRRYLTISGKPDIRPGINAVKSLLEVDKRLGRPKFFVCKDQYGKVVAPNMVFEFENYSESASNENKTVPKNESENPIKLNDHAMDCNKNLILKLRQPASRGHRTKPRGM